MKKKISVLLLALLLLTGCGGSQETIPPDSIPEYTGESYTILNNNEPEFEEFGTESFEEYGELDHLGRCTTAYANIGRDLMPTEDRTSIGMIKPTGWHTVTYDNVDGRYLYNRCHLIGFQLTGENANERNLITGTRYMNVDGMLPFEDMVADYIHETENHVLYRVTPVYEGDNLLASGVQMEAFSVEDNGEGICFNVFVHNIQPGISIDYATGESRLETSTEEALDTTVSTYVLNTNTNKYHRPDCSSVTDMDESNRKDYTGTIAELKGYEPCGRCNQR